MKKTVLILGATSTIAQAAAYELAKKGYSLYLAGRDVKELQRTAEDIRIRCNASVQVGSFDAQKWEDHAAFLQSVVRKTGGLEGVLLAFGTLGDTQSVNNQFQAANEIIQTNFTGACSILNECANYFAVQEKGFIIGISSVAGDRGRQRNYIYGATKAGLNVVLQGIRQRLDSHGVRVITIKPGFVDTAMTFGLPHIFLNASPTAVGKKIAASVDRWSDIVYVPWFWQYIMAVLKWIPEKIYKKMKFL